jgi:hypothetical protein
MGCVGVHDRALRIPFSNEGNMLWAFAAAASIGLVLGLRFRAPSVIVASAIVVAGGVAVAPLTGLPFWTALAAILGGLCALQGGYIVGLMLWCALSRTSGLRRATPGDRAAPEDADVGLPPSRPSTAAGN